MDNIEQDLLTTVIAQLTDAGVPTRLIAAEPGTQELERKDALIAVTWGDYEERRPVEIRNNLTGPTLGAIREQLRGQPGGPILVTGYVTPPLADRLRDAGVQFADAAGNAYIEAKHFLVNIRGRQRKEHQKAGMVSGRAFEPGGLRILFAILINPEYLNLNYRQMAQAVGVAHGTVGWVMADLAARGFVVTFNAALAGKRRRLVNVEKLVQMWIEAYARALRPKLTLARYRVDNFNRWVENFETQPDVLVGGEIAAAKITGHLKPGTATFWADKINPRFLIDNRLILDPAGNIELMKRFWQLPERNTGLVPDLLTYADLLQIGDARTLETADLMKDRVYDRLIHQN